MTTANRALKLFELEISSNLSGFIPLLDSKAQLALQRIQNYFKKQNIMRRLRNKFSFHYDFVEALKQIDKFPGISDLHIFLEEADVIVVMFPRRAFRIKAG